MEHTNNLYLASSSQSRQELLRLAHIPFILAGQHADESQCNWGLSLPQLVQEIARYKMAHALLPDGSDGDTIFVLTADTLSQDMSGNIHGKPTSPEQAIYMIKQARDGARLATGFCLERKRWRDNAWRQEQRIEAIVTAEYLFDVPDNMIAEYMRQSPCLSASNAITIEDYGLQFLHSVSGSYTAIIGLPLFEVRQALQEIGFFT